MRASGPRATSSRVLQITTPVEDSLPRGTRLGARSRPVTYRGARVCPRNAGAGDRPEERSSARPDQTAHGDRDVRERRRTQRSPGAERRDLGVAAPDGGAVDVNDAPHEIDEPVLRNASR